MSVYLQRLGFILCLSVGIASQTIAADSGFKAALASPDRPAADKARDEARRPIEVVEFLGIDSGMTVVDVLAGGGWFTEVLSGAVGPNGRVISQLGPRMLEMNGGAAAEAARARAGRLGNVEPKFENVDALGIDGTADAAVTAMNLHDIYNFGGEAGAASFMKGVFTALKPGGVFGVIDHTGIAGQKNGELHRIEPAVARKLLLDAGFVIDAESDILANPADDHTLPIRDGSLARKSDQFLFRARKPAP
jgi:predicted methyltransferase